MHWSLVVVLFVVCFGEDLAELAKNVYWKKRMKAVE